LAGSKCLVLTGRYPFYKVYASVLTSIHTLLCLPVVDTTTAETLTISLPVPIERLIVFFLEEIPLPPCGKARLHFSLAPSPEFASLVPIIEMERPPLNRLPLANFSFDVLVRCLSASQIITVVTSLLLVRKAVFLRYY
jgi:hypothetical protein